MPSPTSNRRDFLRASAAAAAGGLALPHLIPRRALGGTDLPGANDLIRVGFIGVGGRADWILKNESLPGAQVVAVADCNLPLCAGMANSVPGGDKWRQYQDYRRMFDKEKLDAVFVETTTHARVRICIHALQAGLDVYGEKPLTLTIAEGRTLVDAVGKYNRIFQTGSQQRSMPINIHASKLVREGAIGKVHTVIACNFFSGNRWTPKSGQPIPEGLDWDHWCNQTELRPYHPDLHNGWKDLLEFDDGGMSWGLTGFGTHAFDQVQCALGTDDTGPVEIWPDEPGWNCKLTMRYANGTLLKLQGKKRGQEDLGAIFIGDKGKIEILRGRYRSNPKELLEGAPPITPAGPNESVPHLQNFLESVRTRKTPNTPVEVGHRSTTVCHLASICRQLARKLQWDPQAEKFVGDDEANSLLSRPRRKGYELPDIT